MSGWQLDPYKEKVVGKKKKWYSEISVCNVWSFQNRDAHLFFSYLFFALGGDIGCMIWGIISILFVDHSGQWRIESLTAEAMQYNWHKYFPLKS